MLPQVALCRVVDRLPEGFDALAAEAAAEGYRHIRRLDADWRSSALRFTRPGESLMAAVSGDELAAVGGMTIDPVEADAFRMRRFYVRARFRRNGVGRALAQALIATVMPGRLITVHAGSSEAPAFWESLGFVPTRRDGYSHILRRTC